MLNIWFARRPGVSITTLILCMVATYRIYDTGSSTFSLTTWRRVHDNSNILTSILNFKNYFTLVNSSETVYAVLNNMGTRGRSTKTPRTNRQGSGSEADEVDDRAAFTSHLLNAFSDPEVKKAFTSMVSSSVKEEMKTANKPLSSKNIGNGNLQGAGKWGWAL